MNYKKSVQTLKDYYSNLLIVQYHDKPKAIQTIEMLVDLIYINLMLKQIEYAFDWKTAVGTQLDIIGEWVGVSRSYNVPIMANKTLLAYPETDKLLPTDITTNNQHGYSDYSTFGDNDGGMLRYEDVQGLDNELNDENYRIVIGLKIIYNSINHVAGEIDKAIWEYFEENVYTTWSAHTLIYNYTSDLSDIINICYYKNVLPAPIGVEILLNEV